MISDGGQRLMTDWSKKTKSHLLCVKEQQTLGYNFCVRAPHESRQTEVQFQPSWPPCLAFFPFCFSHPLLLELSLAHHPHKNPSHEVWFEETLPKITSIRSKPGKQVLRTGFWMKSNAWPDGSQGIVPGGRQTLRVLSCYSRGIVNTSSSGEMG